MAQRIISCFLVFVHLHITGSLGSGEIVSTPNPQELSRFRHVLCYLKGDLDSTKTQLQELTDKHTDMEIKNLQLENELLKLKLQFVQLSEELEDTKQDLHTSKLKNTELEQQINLNISQPVTRNLQDEQLSAMRGELSSVLQQVATQSRELNEIKASLRNTQDTPIAFAVHSTLAASLVSDYAGVLIFQTEVTNLGQHYDRTTGNFTCPMNGLYVFSYNVRGLGVDDGEDIFVELQLNGQSKWYSYCYNYNSLVASFNCGGTVVLQCQSGDKVRVHKSGNGQASSDNHTWFTGLFIKPM